jgi:hypothetical protein
MNTVDWISVTVADSGYRKRVRASAIVSYGTMPGSSQTFIDLAGRTIEVHESETAIAQLVGDMPATVSPPPRPPPSDPVRW